MKSSSLLLFSSVLTLTIASELASGDSLDNAVLLEKRLAKQLKEVSIDGLSKTPIPKLDELKDESKDASKEESKATSDHVAGELLILFKGNQPNSPVDANNSVFQSLIKRKASKYKVRKRKVISKKGIEHWKLDDSVNLQTIIKELKSDPDVLLVEPNYRRYPRAEILIDGSTAKNYSDNTLAQINLDKLRSKFNTPVVNEPVVAILDDGFDIDHEDLVYVSPYDALDKDFNPRPDTCLDSISNITLSESHGTRVMGVLAAKVGNGIGIDGATESTNIIPIRLGCNYTVAAEIEALDWAREKGARIINMSWGAPQYSAAEYIMLADLSSNDMLLVAAAGNYEVNNDRLPDYPSGLDLPNIIAVTSLDYDNTLSGWSQYGQTSVDIAAPGGELIIGTTFPNDKYVNTTGTSFSAPMVSGLAASLLARNPNATIYDVKGAILGSAVSFSDNLKGRLTTDGYPDALAAHNLLNQIPKPVPLIKSIIIDDSAGNNNHRYDAGENVSLVITIENAWGDADSLDLSLSSSDLGILPIQRTVQSGLAGLVDEIDTDGSLKTAYGKLEVSFPVDFGVRTQSQGILFTLDISGTYASNTKSFQYQRAFTIDTGSLIAGRAVQNRLRTHAQDDAHYYSLYVPEKKAELTVNLEMLGSETANNLNLLVKYNSLPQFDYLNYENYIADSVSRGTEVSANGGSQSESITIENPIAGTYHIVVIGSERSSATNISYSLNTLLSDKKRITRTSSGCVMASNPDSEVFDPLFLLLLAISLCMIRRRPLSESIKQTR
ncbi:MAG: S8 family serine peptidase [Gammaproteobacteria bacterium]|nr:S8 family serine peptidase [Gammaproteobacteria bacterium]